MNSSEHLVNQLDLQNCCDVKLEMNSRSVNMSVHVYEFATRERIDKVIDNAVYAMTTTQTKVAAAMAAK